MSRRISALVCTAFLLAAAGAGVFAVTPALPTVITAGAGHMKKTGDAVAVTLTDNVRLTRVNARGVTETLICQRLAADGVLPAVETVTAEAPLLTTVIEIKEADGTVVKYQVKINGESMQMKDQVATVKGKPGGERAKLTMTPLGNVGKRRVALSAYEITYDLAVDAKGGIAGATPTTFVSAAGQAALAVTQETAGTAQGAAPYSMSATAPRIIGKLEQVGTGAGAPASQVFYFESGEQATPGARPHVEMSSLDPNMPNDAKLDADAIVFYPHALATGTPSSGTPQSPLLALKALGRVQFSGLLKQEKGEAKALTGRAGQFFYQLERSESKERAYDRVICLKRGGRTGVTPQITVTNAGKNNNPLEITAPKVVYNLDEEYYYSSKNEDEPGNGVGGGKQ